MPLRKAPGPPCPTPKQRNAKQKNDSRSLATSPVEGSKEGEKPIPTHVLEVANGLKPQFMFSKSQKPVAKKRTTIQRSCSDPHRLAVNLKTQRDASPINSLDDLGLYEDMNSLTARLNSLPSEDTVCMGKEEVQEPSKDQSEPKAEDAEVVTASNSSPNTYVQFSQTCQPSSSVDLVTMSEQLCAVQMTLSTIVQQIHSIETRQSTFENELRAMKTPEDLDPTATLIASDMSPADVS